MMHLDNKMDLKKRLSTIVLSNLKIKIVHLKSIKIYFLSLHCSDGILELGVFFFQTNFDFLTSCF